MGAALSKVVFKKGKTAYKQKHESLFEIEATTIDGRTVRIGELVQGKKAVMIVNVASK